MGALSKFQRTLRRGWNAFLSTFCCRRPQCTNKAQGQRPAAPTRTVEDMLQSCWDTCANYLHSELSAGTPSPPPAEAPRTLEAYWQAMTSTFRDNHFGDSSKTRGFGNPCYLDVLPAFSPVLRRKSC
ncbi:Ja228.1 [Japanese cytomegalovirus]|nr:Ja228.1 [Japanese cytomegalovirus]